MLCFSSFKKYIFIGLGILIFSTITYNSIYNSGYNSGVSDITLQWEKEKVKYQSELLRLNQEYSSKEKRYKEINLSIQEELNRVKQQYEEDLININNTFTSKLHQSEQRTLIYKSKAKAGEAEREQLAEHASKLDRLITEGQQVVRELGSGIKLRDQVIDKLLKQLKNDRDLMED